MRQLENMWFRPALRLARREIPMFLQKDKNLTLAWSNYDLSRGIQRPIQKMSKVGHWSLPRGQRT